MEELAHSENLKFSAEICLRVRIPPPAPASPSRPVPLIEERGDFFCTRFAGSMTSRRHQIMIFSSSLPIPLRLSNCDMLLSSLSPRRPYRFLAPPHRRTLCNPSCRSSIRFGGTRCRFLPVPPFRWAVRLGHCSYPRSTIRPIGFSLSSSPCFPPSGSVPPLFRADERGVCVFFARVSVSHVDSVANC